MERMQLEYHLQCKNSTARGGSDLVIVSPPFDTCSGIIEGTLEAFLLNERDVTLHQ